jgi:FkbM family methyltransferase
MNFKSLVARFFQHSPMDARTVDPKVLMPGRARVEGDPLVIVDVGCRWGFADAFPLDASDLKVFGFDPDTEECERLRARYEGQQVEIVPLGLAGHPGTRTLHFTRQPACSSLLKPIESLTRDYPALHCAQEERRMEVKTTTLDLWSKDIGLGWVDYVKIDTQGTELEILKGGERLLPGVRALEIEVEFNPIYEGQPLYADIDHYLRQRGFVLWQFTNHVHYSRHPEKNPHLGDDGICFNENIRIERPRYGGQLFWANAHFIHRNVLETQDPVQRSRDERLFQILGMPDVLLDRTS